MLSQDFFLLQHWRRKMGSWSVTVLGGETLWRGAQVSIRRSEGPCRGLAPQRVILVYAYAQREGCTVARTIQKPGIALSKAYLIDL
jgi:hypothetical protein